MAEKKQSRKNTEEMQRGKTAAEKKKRKSTEEKEEKIVSEDKIVIPKHILEIIKSEADEENGITQQRILKILREKYNKPIARNTLTCYLKKFIASGESIDITRRGVQYYGRKFRDGELRQMIDQIFSTPFLEEDRKEIMAKELYEMGTGSFQNIMSGIVSRMRDIRMERGSESFGPVTPYDVSETVDTIQKAIHLTVQIRFNYLRFYYDGEILARKEYADPIAVDPYGFLFKNGNYFLVGSVHGSGKISAFRVDRICDLEVLRSERRDPVNPVIEQYGGVSGYAQTQPNLKGGVMETFRIQCGKDDIDEIVDIFGTSLRDVPAKDPKKRNNDILVVEVRTTREAMKSWALANATKICVIEPKDFQQDILDCLSEATRAYRVADRKREDPNYSRKENHIARWREFYEARTFEDCVEVVKKQKRPGLIYSGKIRSSESVDLTPVKQVPDIKLLILRRCKIQHPEALSECTALRQIVLEKCEYDLSAFVRAVDPEIFETDDVKAARALAEAHPIRSLTLVGSGIRDLSELSGIQPVGALTLQRCRKLKDVSTLTADPAFASLSELRIMDCPCLADFSFLKELPSLKKVTVISPLFDAPEALKMKEETGIEELRIEDMEELDEETLKKLGLKESEIFMIQRRRKRREGTGDDEMPADNYRIAW